MKLSGQQPAFSSLPCRLLRGCFSLCWALLMTPAHGALEYLSQKLPVSPDLGYQVIPQLEGAGGVLYGVATRGPSEKALVAHDLEGANFRVLHVFGSVPEDGNPGIGPRLAVKMDGFIYGFCQNGGTNRINTVTDERAGMIFRVKPDGSDYQVLYSFPGPLGGGYPNSLVLDTNRNLLFGTTRSGGKIGAGFVFRMNSSGGEPVILVQGSRDFGSSEGIAQPAGLLLASDGLLYGFAEQIETRLPVPRIFKAGNGENAVSPVFLPVYAPIITLLESRDGRLYASTKYQYYEHEYRGGAFSIKRDGTDFKTLLELPLRPDAKTDDAKTLIEGRDGGLYGTLSNGAVFRLNLDGTGFSVVAPSGGSDSLLEGSNDVIYCGNGVKLVPLPTGAPRIFSQGVELTENQVQLFGTRALSLTSSIPNAKIFYTTDGTAPSAASQPYVFPFEVSLDSVIRAVAYTSDLSRSAERSAVSIDIVPVWTLKTTVTGGVGSAIPGTVILDPAPSAPGTAAGESLYPVGSTLTLTATPSLAYQFVRWDGAGGGTTSTKIVTLNADLQVTAVFEPRPKFSLRAFTKGGGLIAGNAAAPSQDSTVSQFGGLEVELVAIPSPGWVFLRWAGAAAGADPTNRVLMDRAKVVEAVFGATVMTPIVGPGLVEILPNPGPHEFGTKVMLVGHPEPGNFLAHWGETADSAFNPLTYVLGGTVAPVVSATFTVIPAGQVLLTVNVDGPGFVSGNPARNTFTPGQTVTLTAAPAAGEVFRGWSYRVGDQDFASLDPMLSLTVTVATTATAHFGNVSAPPAITVHPQPVTVIQGYPATFGVVAGGGEPRTYQWWRGGVKLPEDAHFKGATNATLTITQVNPLDAGSYTVEVSNASGSVTSNPAVLTVLDGQADTDGDGLRNGEEGVLKTDPTLADTDGDGLNDFREARELGTNPIMADTDGDGFTDGTEVAAGTDPKDGSESPDGRLTAYFAVELEFFTLGGKNYQLQQSTDLQKWADVGSPFVGTGNRAGRFVSTRGNTQTYWRLQPVP